VTVFATDRICPRPLLLSSPPPIIDKHTSYLPFPLFASTSTHIFGQGSQSTVDALSLFDNATCKHPRTAKRPHGYLLLASEINTP